MFNYFSFKNMAKVIVVFGANSALGAAVAKSLTKDSNCMVKAVDPDGSGPYSSEIRASGAQVVPCNLDDVGSIRQVLSGCGCAFVTTVSNFNNPDFMDEEIRQGMNIADACAGSNVSHVVFNTGLHTIKIIGTAARHLVAKAEVEAYMKGKGIPLTSLLIPTLYEDILGILQPLPAGQNNRWLGKYCCRGFLKHFILAVIVKSILTFKDTTIKVNLNIFYRSSRTPFLT